MEYGQKIYRLVDGKIDDRFDMVLQLLYEQQSDVWGAYMPLSSFLLSEEHVEQELFELARTFWDYIHKRNTFQFRALGLDLDFVNERLYVFFTTKENKAKLLHYATVHRQLTFESLYYFIFERKVTFPQTVSSLLTIHLYKVGERYFVQPIFEKHESYWQHLFAKKVYSIFMQAPLADVSEPFQLMLQLHKALQVNCTKKQTAKLIYKIVRHVSAHNERSFELKQLELFNVLSHFIGGRRYRRKLQHVTRQLYECWGDAQWRLTEKEQALTTYLLMCTAYEARDFSMTRECGNYLLYNNRIFNHAVEILIEYEYFIRFEREHPHLKE